MCDILIENATIVTLDPKRNIIKNGVIAIDKNMITDVGHKKTLKNKYKADKVIDAKDMIVMPGFVNSHTHAMDILLRGGLCQDRVLYDWLFNAEWPALHTYTAQDAQTAATLYCMEAIRAGITTIVDNEELAIRDTFVDPILDVYKQTGIRAVYGWNFYDALEEENEFMKTIKAKEPDVLRPQAKDMSMDTHEALIKLEKTIRKHHKTENGRIHIWPGPCVAVLMSKEGLLGSLELARKYDTMVTIHVAESKNDEMQHGMRSVEYLSMIGFLDPRILAAHCVWVNDKDLRLLQLHDVKVSHQAVSNMIIASGIAPIPKMLARGITVGLGTDDANVNDSVNMIQLMKVTALLHKVNTLDATAITAEKVLEMATIDGAKAIGMEKEIGSIEKGKKADIIILDLKKPHLVPCHHIPSVLVYQAHGSEVETTIVDGKVLMENRTFSFMDKEQEKLTMAKAQQASEEIVARAKMDKLKNRGWQSFLKI